MYCRSCGNEVNGVTEICPNCGVRPLNGRSYCQHCAVETRPEQEMCVKCGKILGYQRPPSNEDAPWLAKLASCCFPIAGIVLYFVWRDEKPIASNSICLWTVIGFTWPILFYIIALVTGFIFAAPLNYF